MLHRDFCYWLQGYFEIAQPRDTLTIGEWNTIVEHLTLTYNLASMEGMGGFTRFVEHMWGFIQINGRQVPGNDQIKHIKNSVADLFEKVTSEPNELEHCDPEILLERIREKTREREREQGQTSPWNEERTICSTDSITGRKLCSDDGQENFCCSNTGFTPDGAWPDPAYDNFVADGQYPPQCNDKLGTDPLK